MIRIVIVRMWKGEKKDIVNNVSCYIFNKFQTILHNAEFAWFISNNVMTVVMVQWTEIACLVFPNEYILFHFYTVIW